MKVTVDPYHVPIGLRMGQSETARFLIRFKSREPPPERLFGNILYQVISDLSAIQNNFILKALFEFCGSFLGFHRLISFGLRFLFICFGGLLRI